MFELSSLIVYCFFLPFQPILERLVFSLRLLTTTESCYQTQKIAIDCCAYTTPIPFGFGLMALSIHFLLYEYALPMQRSEPKNSDARVIIVTADVTSISMLLSSLFCNFYFWNTILNLKV